MASGILTLPPELVLMILESDLCQVDYLNLCYIRFFRHFTEQLLYQEFRGHHANLRPFLRTILGNNRLASYVQHVNLQNLCYAAPVQSRTRGWRRLVNTRVRTLALPPAMEDYWIRQLRRGNGEALAGLLLVCLPNIKKLEVWAEDRYEYRERRLADFNMLGKPFWALSVPTFHREPVVAGTTAFTKLKEIKLLSQPFSIVDLVGVARLPSVTKVHAYDVFEPPEYQLLPRIAEKCSNVTNLALTAATMSADALVDLILACKALQDFTYDCPADTRVPNEIQRVFEALYSHESSLENIFLRDQGPYLAQGLSSSTLKRFQQLRKFVGDGSLFYHIHNPWPLSSILPRNIENVRLHNVHPQFIASLGEPRDILNDITSVEGSEALFPRLRGVSLVHGLDYFEEEESFAHSQEIGLELNGCFVSNGVELQIVDRFFYDLVDSGCEIEVDWALEVTLP